MIKIMKLQDTSTIHMNYHNVSVSNSMGELCNGTIVLELVEGSSDSTVIPIFYPFIPELCSLSLETYYSGNYAGILASALHLGSSGVTWNRACVFCYDQAVQPYLLLLNALFRHY